MTDETKILLTKYLSGKISPEEYTVFESWINQNEENKKLFHDIRSVWLLSGIEPKDSSSSYKKVWSRIEHKIQESEKESGENTHVRFAPKHTFKKVLANAAMFILAICLGGLLMYFINTKGIFMKPLLTGAFSLANDTVEVIAKKGSKSEVVLPDGSKVWLNSNSKIKYYPGFNNAKREVFLIGEAYFDVKHTEDESLFYVHTSDIHVKVLGTEFNVKSYPDEGTIETTLEKGKVEIEKTVHDKLIKLISLEPNQQATFIKQEGKIYVSNVREEIAKNNAVLTQQLKRKEQIILNEKVDTERYTSWKDGRLQFVSETFENMVVKFERWYDVGLKIENEELKDIVFTATFEKHTIEQALNALKLTHDFDYEYNLDDNTIIIK